jgi:Pvc16 N-terminal domain
MPHPAGSGSWRPTLRDLRPIRRSSAPLEGQFAHEFTLARPLLLAARMASFLAIAAVARTVLRLLEEQVPREEFTKPPTFALYQGHNFGTPAIDEGFSLMLYRVTVNGARSQPPTRSLDGVKRRPALPLDLQFLLTPWAQEPERQLRLLGWAMRFLHDHAVLPANELNHSLSQRELAVFRADEGVELFCDPPSVADYLGLWDKYKTRWQTSVTYTARMVLLESAITLLEGPLVQTRELRYGEEAREQ